MKYTKEEVRAANSRDIVEVASELGMTLKRQGATVMTLCTSHEDTHPSMQVGGRRNIAHCYVCGKTLTPLSLVMEVTGKNFKEAMEWLGVNQRGQTPLIHSGRNRKSGSCVNHGGQPPAFCSSAKAILETKKKEQNIINFNMAYVDAHVSVDNALSKCLLYRFPREVVERVTQMYKLGHDENLLHYEHTWFPSIDQQGRVRNIKVQGYCTNPDVPMFGHSVKGQTCWLGSMLRKDEKGEFDNECLFGEQLLRWTPFARMGTSPFQGEDGYNLPTKSIVTGSNHSVLPLKGGGARMGGEGPCTVVLVESPKNAVVGACWTMAERPDLDLVWVAVGNKGMLKREVLEPLRGRKVLVIPDRDAVDEWRRKIGQMRDLATFIFSDFCQSTEQAENKKLDIADLIMSNQLD